jgi:hypothetical protein
MKKSTLTEDKAEQTPTGGVLVGKRKGQTIIHNKGTLSGYLVGKTHAEGGIKAVNKSTGQPLEMQGGEVIITAPAVSDQTKNEFNGKMMTNREILSQINVNGGGVAFAKGGDIPKRIKRTGASYKYGGKTMTDHEIYKKITGGHLAEGMTLTQIAKKHNVSVKELQKQVDMGMKAESEHTSSKREQMKIVKDHLYENPKYYSLLKRAGLKHGGRVSKASIIRNTKKANEQTKDLNNANDVLDIDADGVYGAETGLFADGGGIDNMMTEMMFSSYDDGGIVKEAVEYITISNYSENPFGKDSNIRLLNFIDFKTWIKELYVSEGATNKRAIYLCINNDDSSSRFRINISEGKNTNSNFNFRTGTFSDLVKSLKKYSEYWYNRFDWNNWGGVKAPKTTQSKTSSLIVPDADSVISIMVLDKDRTTIASAINIDELLDILIEAQKNNIREFKLKYIFYDSSIYQAYYVAWIENSPSMGSDINPYATSPTELKEWLKNQTDLSSKPFNLDYFFSKSINSNVTTPTSSATASVKFTTGDIDAFNQIDAIVDSYGITYVGVTEWDKGNETTDFDIVDTLTGDVFKLRKYKKSLGVQLDDVEIIQSKALIKFYNQWKKSGSPTASASPSSTTSKTLSKEDFYDIKIKINSDFDLALKVVEKLEELGFTDTIGIKNKIDRGQKIDSIWLNKSYVGWFTNESDFNDSDKKEIFPSDLGIGSSNATPTSVPFDLSNTKIWIGDNPALSEKIQKRAFELGWTWNASGKNVANQDKYFLIFDDNRQIGGAYSDDTRITFDKNLEKEIFESDLFPTSTASQTSTQNASSEDEDWVKKFTADLDKLTTYLPNDQDFAPELSKERKDLNDLIKLLPSFQQSKYAVERAKILNEIKKLHRKLTYEGFIKPNEASSSDSDLFTPQGLLDYYFTQATQNPTAELEPACELPTPNGEKSKLPMSAYLNVRTSQFKNWFGDWEKAYETGNYVNCSKMIDPDTKEPKIYFHGVRKFVPNFGQFSNMGQGVVRPYGAFEPPSFPASYFAGEEDYAKFYGGVAENMPTPSTDYKPFIYKVFLSVKNPISLLPLDFMLSYKDFMDYIYVGYGVKVEPNQDLLTLLNNDITRKNPMWFYVRRDIGFIEMLKDYGYDAIFQIGDIPVFLPDGSVEPDRTKHLQEVEYLTFYPSQVKSATVKKSFYFDFFNDIRFKNGGYVCI